MNERADHRLKKDGERLDQYLVRTGAASSRRRAREMAELGHIRVNGRRCVKGAIIRRGDLVEVAEAPPADAITPWAGLDLDVLFESPHLLVFHKPGGLACHPLRGAETGTVMNAIVSRYPETAAAGDKLLEGGLVHRLDNGTSGALIVARTRIAFAELRRIVAAGAVQRTYAALVSGALENVLELISPIAHDPRNRRRMLVAGEALLASRLKARRAMTRVEPLRRVGAFTLVAIHPSTGLRHQIRVHLANAGHPIAGDSLYNGLPLQSLKGARFFLHLERVRLQTQTCGLIDVAAPLASDLVRALDEVGSGG